MGQKRPRPSSPASQTDSSTTSAASARAARASSRRQVRERPHPIPASAVSEATDDQAEPSDPAAESTTTTIPTRTTKKTKTTTTDKTATMESSEPTQTPEGAVAAAAAGEGGDHVKVTGGVDDHGDHANVTGGASAAAGTGSSERGVSPAGKPNLIMVSNRLPLTVRQQEDGSYTLTMSSGGLVTGIMGMAKEVNFTWYGWPGQEVPEAERAGMTETLAREASAVPVFLSRDDMDRHYNGFSNSILWPLLHYHPSDVTFDELSWVAYNRVNHEFAATIAANAQDGDVIWVHDYHHFILPQMLRDALGSARANVKIGFFLHTPFPSSEMFRILPVPVREGILRSLLACDLVGFHTYDYARHFLSSCQRILGVNTLPNGAEVAGRFVTVGAFPIGIDVTKFDDAFRNRAVLDRIGQLERKFAGVRVVVGVDRLDYIKGMPQKLHSFELFLTEHPEWVGKIVLVQVAVPSRQDVDEYRDLWKETNELVGRINGKFGTVEYMPIHWLYHSVSFEEMTALYAVSDACLVTSTRDGMNLVSYEYVAAQNHRHGVLILSEFAGAAQSLYNGALIINPWNTEDVAKAIYTAVTMPASQRTENFQKLRRYVYHYTSQWWGQSFVNELCSGKTH